MSKWSLLKLSKPLWFNRTLIVMTSHFYQHADCSMFLYRHIGYWILLHPDALRYKWDKFQCSHLLNAKLALENIKVSLHSRKALWDARTVRTFCRSEQVKFIKGKVNPFDLMPLSRVKWSHLKNNCDFPNTLTSLKRFIALNFLMELVLSVVLHVRIKFKSLADS